MSPRVHRTTRSAATSTGLPIFGSRMLMMMPGLKTTAFSPLSMANSVNLYFCDDRGRMLIDGGGPGGGGSAPGGLGAGPGAGTGATGTGGCAVGCAGGIGVIVLPGLGMGGGTGGTVVGGCTPCGTARPTGKIEFAGCERTVASGGSLRNDSTARW